jgi:hypothetical protein
METLQSVGQKIKHKMRLSSKLTLWVIGIVVLLIGARLALPFAVESYVNRQLNKNETYAGSIGKVSIHLWRGAYQIHNVRILKRTGEVPAPLFYTPLMDLAIEWRELFHGSIVSRIAMNQPELNFVAGPTKEESQTGEEADWTEMLENLAPFKINSFKMTNGQVRFKNVHSTPPVDIFITQLSCVATNFTNTRDLNQKLPAGLTAAGNTLGGGQMTLQILMDPMAEVPTFELTGQLTNVNLVALNDFLRAYGKFDVERGEFALFTSFAAAEGKYDGYCKVLFKDLDVFAWEKERKKNILEIFWQAIVGTLTTAFKNQPKDQLATKIPITGTFEKTDVHMLPAIGALLRNAFIQALLPKVDQPVKLEKVENENIK